MLPAAWHRMDDAPGTNTGVVTVPLVVAVCTVDFGPLHPVAVAVIVELPVHAAV